MFEAFRVWVLEDQGCAALSGGFTSNPWIEP